MITFIFLCRLIFKGVLFMRKLFLSLILVFSLFAFVKADPISDLKINFGNIIVAGDKDSFSPGTDPNMSQINCSFNLNATLNGSNVNNTNHTNDSLVVLGVLQSINGVLDISDQTFLYYLNYLRDNYDSAKTKLHGSVYCSFTTHCSVCTLSEGFDAYFELLNGYFHSGYGYYQFSNPYYIGSLSGSFSGTILNLNADPVNPYKLTANCVPKDPLPLDCRSI